MRGFIGKILGYFGASHELHIKRNVVTYGICVIIATVLWFLNALNKEYTTEITYPIKYTERFRPSALQHQHLFFTDRTQCKFVAR